MPRLRGDREDSAADGLVSAADVPLPRLRRQGVGARMIGDPGYEYMTEWEFVYSI